MGGPVNVVGLVGGEWFGAEAAHAVASATVLVGAPRHLAAVRRRLEPGGGAPPGEVPLAGPLAGVLDGVDALSRSGERVCVLASGDPGFFGIVRVLGARLGAGRLRIHPAPSSVALAFARAGLSWDDATVVSAHGRNLEEAVSRAGGEKVAVLTSPENPPQAIGSALRARGCGRRTVTVVSSLGEPSESIVRTDLDGLAAGSFEPLSVVVLVAPDAASAPGLAWGLPEAAFEHRNRMITKAEVRAVALGKLALPPTGVLWDVGAGSGSVGIECARLRPGLRVVAVEQVAEDAERIRANALAHGVGVEVVTGEAPDALVGLPDPDRVFIGGGGLVVLDHVLHRLRPGGLVVATYALIERAAAAWRRLGEMTQITVARAVAVGQEGPRLSAENPVFVCWGPPEGHVLSSTAEQARSPGLRGKGSSSDGVESGGSAAERRG